MTLFYFQVFQYAAVYRSLDDDDFSGTCKTPFHEDSEQNLKQVNNYSMGIAKPYLQRIGSQKFGDEFVGTPVPQEMTSLPPIVMAVASADFWIVQRSIEKIKTGKWAKTKMDIKFIIYDVGLFKSERAIVSIFTMCNSKDLPRYYFGKIN